jgi:cytochrome bd-type quinol oxidase subunit 2
VNGISQFAKWLEDTAPSHVLRVQEGWLVPGIQSIHIIGIAIIMGSLLMIVLRILGWAGMDQTMRQTTERYGPWLIGGLVLQLVTGLVMILTEPVRELVDFSFWTKMVCVAIGTAIVGVFYYTFPSHEKQWDTLVNRKSIKSLAVVTLVLFLCIIVLGRLIAYDHIWGSWSPAKVGY